MLTSITFAAIALQSGSLSPTSALALEFLQKPSTSFAGLVEHTYVSEQEEIDIQFRDRVSIQVEPLDAKGSAVLAVQWKPVAMKVDGESIPVTIPKELRTYREKRDLLGKLMSQETNETEAPTQRRLSLLLIPWVEQNSQAWSKLIASSDGPGLPQVKLSYKVQKLDESGAVLAMQIDEGGTCKGKGKLTLLPSGIPKAAVFHLDKVRLPGGDGLTAELTLTWTLTELNGKPIQN